MIKAWIEEIKTMKGIRFQVVEESILQRGRRNVINKNWSQKARAMKYITDNGRVFVEGNCPLMSRDY